ncbi:hypothetical protein [Actinoplanes nipponensis]|uniref:hypothetical protein n=1 Tax=Actinoplanes nipponensis TaxID=135950 RepID=UPI0031E60D00
MAGAGGRPVGAGQLGRAGRRGVLEPRSGRAAGPVRRPLPRPAARPGPGRHDPGHGYTRRLFPLFGVDEAFLDRAGAAAATAAPVVRKTLRERADLVRRMLRSRAGGSR